MSKPTMKELEAVLDRIAIPNPVLSGDVVTVTLTMRVPNVFTPQEAATEAMSRVLREGLNQTIVQVTDEEDDRTYLVRGDVTFDPENYPEVIDVVRDIIRRADQHDGVTYDDDEDDD